MRLFAWITFLTGLLVSGMAGFYSVLGLAHIFTGAFWSIVILGSILELAKLVAVSWWYRYRHMVGYWVRAYFIFATIILMTITSMGIFGYLSRAQASTDVAIQQVELSLNSLQQRESLLQEQRASMTRELTTLTDQSSQLITGLSQAQRLSGSSGAVTVQRQLATRRADLQKNIDDINQSLVDLQQERISTQQATTQLTADIGPVRYVAQWWYGVENAETIRKSVVWLIIIMMIVFDPLAIMLLVAANVLFQHLQSSVPQTPTLKPTENLPQSSEPSKIVLPDGPTDVPDPLIRHT